MPRVASTSRGVRGRVWTDLEEIAFATLGSKSGINESLHGRGFPNRTFSKVTRCKNDRLVSRRRSTDLYQSTRISRLILN